MTELKLPAEAQLLIQKERIAQLEAELAECKIEFKQASALLDDALRSIHVVEDERDALAAIVQQQKEEGVHAIRYLEGRADWVGANNFIEGIRKGLLSLDTTQAEQILAKRDAEVLRKAAYRLNRIMGGDGIWQHEVEDELRRMADELGKQ